MVTGDPGIGKTITSDMIVRYILLNNRGYKLRYGQGQNIKSIIESISLDNSKEVVYLDDFLGQTLTELTKEKTNDIKTLLNSIKEYGNKKVILNCRVSILNKAKEEQIEFKKLFSELGIYEYTIDISKINDFDKARIIFNTLKNNNVPEEMFESIKTQRRYRQIINHKSYNSRIIEYCSIHWNDIADNIDFFTYITRNLDNPKCVWMDEFNRIGEYNRLVMYELFSLGNKYIPKRVLKDSVNFYLINNSIVDDTNDFDNSIVHLSKSMISLVYDETDCYVSVVNPSTNDYIQNFLINNSSSLVKIYNSSVYIEQIEKIQNMVEDTQGFETKCIIDYKTYKDFGINIYNADAKYVLYINSNNILDIRLKTYIMSLFDGKHCGKEIVNLFFNQEIYEFYGINSCLNKVSNMSYVFSNAKLEEIFALFKEYYNNTSIDKCLIVSSFKDSLENALTCNLFNYAEDKMIDESNNAFDSEKFITYMKKTTVNEDYVNNLESDTIEEVNYELSCINRKFLDIGYDINTLNIDVEDIVYSVNIQDYLENVLSELLHDDDEEYDFESYSGSYDIDLVFEQDYSTE